MHRILSNTEKEVVIEAEGACFWFLFFSFFLMILGLELKASHLLGRPSTT
jgi:hypothetical protein